MLHPRLCCVQANRKKSVGGGGWKWDSVARLHISDTVPVSCLWGRLSDVVHGMTRKRRCMIFFFFFLVLTVDFFCVSL